MKLISSRSSKDKDNNRNRPKKSIIKPDLSEVPQTHVQATDDLQGHAYPKAELTPAQQAALQNVVYKKERSQENAQRHAQQASRRSPQNKRRDIHAYSDKKLNKRKSPIKGIISAILVILLLSGAIFAAWYYWWHLDRDPPTADTVDVTIQIGDSVKPTDFVRNVQDESEVISIEFVEEPNTLAHSNQTVQVRITDEHENSAIFEARLIIIINTTPPIIEGTDTIVSRLGNPIIFRQGVTAHDDLGRNLTEEIVVDSSRVNHNEIGEYIVTYTVRDITGLETVITETVKVVNVDVDYVHEQIDKILVDVVRDDMTQLQKVRAIHTWVILNIAYASTTGGAETVYGDAYRALRDRSGNCFNFYAIGEIMLTRSGIPNRTIERIPGTPTRHRWSLVNPDDLGWHHFDTTPTRLQWGSRTAFFTDSQAREFTREFIDYNGTLDYFTYDPSLYPPVVQ